MTITVLSKAIPDGGSVYYTPAWRNNIEFHLAWLLASAGTSTFAVADSDTIKYQFDFYGLLQAYNMPVWTHYIILRMNNLLAPTDYDGTLSIITIPSTGTVNRILSVYQAIQQKVKTIA
jgi:hypothetical protein